MGLCSVRPLLLWAVRYTRLGRHIFLFSLERESLFEQRRPSRLLVQLFLPEQPDRSVHAVITGFADHFLFAQTGDGLRNQRVAAFPNIFQRNGVEQLQFGPELVEQALVVLAHLLTLRTHMQELG